MREYKPKKDGKKRTLGGGFPGSSGNRLPVPITPEHPMIRSLNLVKIFVKERRAIIERERERERETRVRTAGRDARGSVSAPRGASWTPT
jgi:hypothetical protein